MQECLLALQFLFDLTESSTEVAALPFKRFTGHGLKSNASLRPSLHTIFSSACAFTRSKLPNKQAQSRKGKRFLVFIIIIILMLWMSLLTWLRYHHKSKMIAITQRSNHGSASVRAGWAELHYRSPSADCTTPAGRWGGSGRCCHSIALAASEGSRALQWESARGAQHPAGIAREGKVALKGKWTEPPCCCLWF